MPLAVEFAAPRVEVLGLAADHSSYRERQIVHPADAIVGGGGANGGSSSLIGATKL